MLNWVIIENPEGDAELIGTCVTRKECLEQVSGNYSKVKTHAWRKGCYFLSSDKKQNKYLVCRTKHAFAMGYDYLLMS